MFKGAGEEKLWILDCLKFFIDIKRTAKGISPVWVLALPTFIKSKSMLVLFLIIMSENLRTSVFETHTNFLTYPDLSQQENHIYISALWELRKLKYKKRYCLW